MWRLTVITPIFTILINSGFSKNFLSYSEAKKFGMQVSFAFSIVSEELGTSEDWCLVTMETKKVWTRL